MENRPADNQSHQSNQLVPGLQMFTLRDHTRTPEDTLATLDRVRDIGYRSIQVQPDCCALSLTDCAAAAGERGLTVCATHVATDWILQKTDEVIQAHLDIHCDLIGIGEMPRRYWGSSKGVRDFARDCAAAAREIHQSGLHLIYHNHHFEFQRYEGLSGLAILLAEADPTLCFELDTYWAQAGGADPAWWIRHLAGRVPIVHLKDMVLNEKWEQEFAPVGEGNMNWPEILQACREAGTRHVVVEQDRCKGSAWDSVETSWRNLQSLLQ